MRGGGGREAAVTAIRIYGWAMLKDIANYYTERGFLQS